MKSKLKKRRAVIRKINVLISTADIPVYGILLTGKLATVGEWEKLLISVAIKLLIIYIEYKWEDGVKNSPEDEI